MFSFWRSKKLEDHLKETRLVKVHGIIFRIKRLDPLSYVDGSNSLTKLVDTYDNKKANEKDVPPEEIKVEKIKKHYKDVLLSSVIEPKLARKEGDEGILVDNLFTDWSLVNALYDRITDYTYGKKKIKSSIYQNQNLGS